MADVAVLDDTTLAGSVLALQRVNAESDTSTIYQALFSDTDSVPWSTRQHRKQLQCPDRNTSLASSSKRSQTSRPAFRDPSPFSQPLGPRSRALFVAPQRAGRGRQNSPQHLGSGFDGKILSAPVLPPPEPPPSALDADASPARGSLVPPAPSPRRSFFMPSFQPGQGQFGAGEWPRRGRGGQFHRGEPIGLDRDRERLGVVRFQSQAFS